MQSVGEFMCVLSNELRVKDAENDCIASHKTLARGPIHSSYFESEESIRHPEINGTHFP